MSLLAAMRKLWRSVMPRTGANHFGSRQRWKADWNWGPLLFPIRRFCFPLFAGGQPNQDCLSGRAPLPPRFPRWCEGGQSLGL
jgi:hypothetical protein